MTSASHRASWIIRVPAPALSHLRPALRLAGPARPVIGIQGRRAARAAARGRRAASGPSAAQCCGASIWASTSCCAGWQVSFRPSCRKISALSSGSASCRTLAMAGESVDHRLDLCPWFLACGGISIHDSCRPFKLHGIHKFLGTRRDPLQGCPNRGPQS